MRGLFIVLALVLPVGLAKAADQPVYAPPAAWVKPHEPAKSIGPDTTTPTRILLEDTQVNFDGAAREIYAEGVSKIQTPQGLTAVGNLALAWKPDTDTLTIHKLHIIRGDQVIDLLANGRVFTVLRRENNLEMAMLDGALTAAIQPEGMQVGDILDLAFTMKRVDPVLQGHAESMTGNLAANPVDRLIYRETWPKSKTMRFRQTDGLAQAKTVATGDDSELSLTMDKVEPPKSPKGAPPRYFALGEIEGSDFHSWAEVSALMEPLFEKASTLAADSPLKAEAAKIKAASGDSKVQAMAALKLVEDQIRYLFLGMNNGGYVPADADQTWSRRFGDCKGKTAILIALLHELGIEAEPAMASIQRGDGLDEHLPMLEVFDHVLVRAVIGGKVYWLDGTRSGDRNLDDLPIPGFHWLLPVQKSGAELVKLTIPIPQEPLTATDVQIDASAGIDASAKVHAVATFRADAGIILNLQLKGATPENLDKGLRNYWKRSLDWVDITKVDAAYDQKTGEERLTMDGSGKMEWKNYLGGAGREYQIESGTLGWRADFDREAGSKADTPFLVAFPFFSEAKETIKLPHGGMGFFVDATDTDRTAAGIAFKRSTKVSGDTLTMIASAKAVVPEFPATSAAQAKADLRALADVAVYLHAPPFSASGVEIGAIGETERQTLGQSEALLRSCRTKAVSGKDLKGAVGDCDAALKLDPDSDDIKMARGFAYLKSGRYDAAMADYRDVLRRRPNSPTALFGLGQAELKSGAAGGGQAELALARTKNSNIDTDFNVDLMSPTSVPAVANVPRDIVAQGSNIANTQPTGTRTTDSASFDFDAALKRAPKSDALYTARGMLYLRQHRPDKAAADFDHALKLNPKATAAMLGRANIAESKNNFPMAVSLLTHALEIDPNHEEARLYRAQILASAGHYDDAVKDVNFLIGKVPGNPVLLNDRCWFRAIAGQELAIPLADCDASIGIKDVPSTRDSRGLVNLRLGKFDDSIADYDKALSAKPNLATSLYGRGIAKLKTGADAGGHADITAALAIDPKVQKEFAGYGVRP